MHKRAADIISIVFCVLWLGALLIVTTGYQGDLRTLLASESTATWVGAFGTIAAVVSGFWLSRLQAVSQAAQVQAAERRAVAARLRAAAMIMRGAYTSARAITRDLTLSEGSRDTVRTLLDRGFENQIGGALREIYVSSLPVPAAIDSVMAGRGQVHLLVQRLSRFSQGAGIPGEIEEIQQSVGKFAAYFVTLANASQHFDPTWSTPTFQVDLSDEQVATQLDRLMAQMNERL